MDGIIVREVGDMFFKNDDGVCMIDFYFILQMKRNQFCSNQLHRDKHCDKHRDKHCDKHRDKHRDKIVFW